MAQSGDDMIIIPSWQADFGQLYHGADDDNLELPAVQPLQLQTSGSDPYNYIDLDSAAPPCKIKSRSIDPSGRRARSSCVGRGGVGDRRHNNLEEAGTA